MAILEALKRRYRRKKEFKKYQEGTQRKKEYARYRNTYLGTNQPVAKMQSYAQWHEDKYGKYEKKKKTSKTPMKRSKSVPKTTRTKAVETGLRKAGIDWDRDKPSKKLRRSKKSK